MLRLILAVVVGSAASLAYAESPAKTKMPLWDIEKNILYFTNAQRESYRLPPLELDPQLQHSARQHCVWMARSGQLTHTSAAVAENIAMGQTHSQQAVGDWMQSPGHRANMLNGSYRRVGAAAYRSPSGAIFWCIQFLR